MTQTTKEKTYAVLPMRHRWTQIPFNKGGDPQFVRLDQIRGIFTDDEVVILVNRALYAMNYQKESHERRYQRQIAQRTEDTKDAKAKEQTNDDDKEG